VPRFRRRLSVLLNADETLERANGLLERLDSTLDEFDDTLKEFNATLVSFTAALEQFGPVVAKVDSVGSDLEVAVGRVDELASGLGGMAGPAFRIPEQIRRIAGRGGGKDPEEPEAPPADPAP
jgi:ABC-type transporter Mla subunit MlaD